MGKKTASAGMEALKDVCRGIVERSMDGIIIVQGGIVRFANPRLGEMYGGPLEEVIGTALSDHVYPEDRPLALERYRRRLAGEPISRTYETRLLRKDGTAVWADVSGSVIDFEGRPADLLFIREIDERKKAEAALRASEEEFRLHFENISDVVYALDLQLRVTSISPSVEKALGYKPEEIVGRPFAEMPFITPETIRIAAVNIPRILAGETIPTTVYEFMSKDGRKIIGEVTGTPLRRDGKIIGLVAVARDITRRRESEAALAAGIRELEASRKRAQEARAVLEAVLESPPDVVLFALDREFRYLAFNRNHRVTMKAIWGADIEIGVSMLDYISDPADREKARLNFERALGGEAFVINEEYGDTGKQRRFYEDRYSPIRDENGRIIGLTLFLTDITERRRAEEALRASEERFAKVFKFSPLAIAVARMNDGILLDVNPAWEERTGYGRSEAVGRKSTDLNVWADPEDRRRFIEAMAPTGSVQNVEIRMRNRNGEIFVILMSAGRTEIEGEQYLLTMSTDITETRKAESALKALALRHEALLAAVPEIVMEVDARRIYTWANTAGLEFFGEDVIGKPADLFFEGDQDINEAVTPLFDGQADLVSLESWQRRKDGQKRLLAWRCRPLRDADGVLTGALSSARDITDERRDKESLRERESQLSIAMMIARLGYWEYDVARDEFHFNDHFYDVLRTTAERAGGYRMSSARYASLFVHPEDAPLVAEEVRKALASTDPNYESRLEHRVIFGDGTDGHVSVRIYAVKDAGGRTIRTYGANQDITERKRAEMLVLASLKEKEVLLRELHHRVKNNMQIISSLMNLQAGRVKDPSVVQAFKETQRRIRSMALVHEKLYQSESLSTIRFDNYLESLAVHLFNSFENTAAGIELLTDLEPILLDIQSAVPCGLLVNELLSNALKHAFPAGRTGRVRVGLRRIADGRIELRVQDDGIGLPGDFDIRGAKTLGLQIVTSLVEQLDGSLEIGRHGGTEFRIVFKEVKSPSRP